MCVGYIIKFCLIANSDRVPRSHLINVKERMIYIMSDEELNKINFYDYKQEMCDELDQMAKDAKIDFAKGRDQLYEELQDLAFDRDITGNRIGSYWCDELKAERCLLGNFDLLQETIDDFGTQVIDSSDLLTGEYLDILIREHLLPDVIEDVMDKNGAVPF